MRRARNLEQTPGLIDPDSADDVGGMGAAVGIDASTSRADAVGDVPESRAVPHRRIVEADAGGHAVAELGGVLDVVYAGIGVVAAEQARVDVAWKAVPGRRVGRRGLTEGEAGKLDEEIFDRDIATARGVERVCSGARESDG